MTRPSSFRVTTLAAAAAVALLGIAGPAAAGTKPAKKAAPKGATVPKSATAPAVSLPPPEILVGMEKLIESRSNGSFADTSVYLSLAGKDVAGIKSARAIVKSAKDDLGNDLAASAPQRGRDDFAEAREGQPPLVYLTLGVAPRKATKLTASGTLEAFLPERDPASRLDVADFKKLRDKPLQSPALKAMKVELTLHTKAGLQAAKAKVEADEKAKKEKAAKGKKKADDGLEQMAESIGSALASMLENLLYSVAENDVALRVKDPDGRIFSFEVLGPDGKPLRSYGTLGRDQEFRVVKMAGPVPDGSTFRVYLKSPATLVQVPFTLTDVVLP